MRTFLMMALSALLGSVARRSSTCAKPAVLECSCSRCCAVVEFDRPFDICLGSRVHP